MMNDASETPAVHNPLLTLGSAIAVLAMEWIIFATNLLTMGEGIALFAVLGGIIAGCATVGLQVRNGHESYNTSLLKGLGVTILVAVPLPALGTLLGFGTIAWELIRRPDEAKA